MIPAAHGRDLAAAAPEATLVLHDCAHNDCPPEWSEHVALVLRFLAEKEILRGM